MTWLVPPKKAPRVDLRKLREGGPGDRRAAVDLLGDSLRELGVVRLQHAAAEAGGAGADRFRLTTEELLDVARDVLRGLEQYFGLAAGELAGLLEPLASGRGHRRAEDPRAALLVLLQPPPAGEIEVALAGGWLASGARPGELVVAPGAALHRLTGGVVPAPEVRWRPEEAEAAAPTGRFVARAAAEPARLAAFAR
ncbi:MAG TPA: hypothetical protein VMT16_12885 [Thermoanaerobaculia bacterium]|nr:hypothetical protein [Thermoanaerobaculia bacterium]